MRLYKIYKKLLVSACFLAITLLIVYNYHVSDGVNSKGKSEVAQSRTVPRTTQLQQEWSHTTKSSHDFTTTNSLTVASDTPSQLDTVLNNIQTCLRITNSTYDVNQQNALENAELFFNTHRKVVPQEPLPDYASHCWKEHFDVSQVKYGKYKGHIGKFLFNGFVPGSQQTLVNSIGSLKSLFNGAFQSELICLPNVFLAGFPKCGSTYAFCFLQSLLHFSAGLRMGAQTEVEKEPHFWVRVRVSKSVKPPTTSDLGEYLLNFLPGIFKIQEQGKTQVRLVDGTPNMLFDWPRFYETQSNTTNYCLLPSALPVLLPTSKYILIMRNPLKMLYSAFWFSCFTKGISVPRDVQLIGPNLFHDRIKSKMDLFNDCMRDKNVPHISEPCSLTSGTDYGECITKRLHLLDHCTRKITFNLFSKELPECGRSRVEMGLFYVHLRKLLSVVPRERVLAITLEQLVKQPTVVAERLLRFLGYPVSEDIMKMVKRITLTCNQNSQDAIPYKTDPLLKMKDETRTMILDFYKPFNALLAELLHDDLFLWN